jgi:predicted exporter
MDFIFINIYRYFHRHRLQCWLSMVALFVFFGYFAAQLHLEEDINKLMPSSKNEDGTTKLAFADLRIKDKTFLLFERKADSVTTEQMAETCDEFVEDLGQGVGSVFYRLPDDLLPDAIAYLQEHLPAYIDTSAYAAFDTLLTREHLLRQMEQNREDLEGEFGSMFPELIQSDPLGLRNVLAAQMSPLLNAGGGSYTTIDGHFFVKDSSVCVAFITPQFSATNTGQGSALFARMNELIDSFATVTPDINICYHGTPASGYYNSTVIKHDLPTPIAGSLVLVLLFIMGCFRRWDTLPLLLLPVVFGTLFAMAVMYFLRGQFSLLALGIGGVVLGVALSYVLHVLTHRHYVNDGEQLLREQTKPLLLGCITTIGSFGGLFFTNTDLLQDFGLFAALAIAATTLFCLVYLPQLMFIHHSSLTIDHSNAQPTANSQWSMVNKINNYPFDRKPCLIAAVVAAIVVCVGAWLWKGTLFDADMHNLGYDDPRVEYYDQLLRSKTYTGDKEKYFAAQGKTMEEALHNFGLLRQKLDSLSEQGLVKDYTPTDRIFIPLDVQQRNIDAWNAYWTAPVSVPSGSLAGSESRLSLARHLITETAPQAGLFPDAFEPFFELTGGEDATLGSVAHYDEDATLGSVAHYEPDALYEAGLIPESYQTTLMEQTYGGDYLCFTAVRCENDSVRSKDSDYMRICDAVCKEPNLMVLDTYYYTTDTLLKLNQDFNILQWLSMAFVFLVLLVSFRFNVKHTLLGFAPILISWLMVLGMMAIFGMRFNLINIIISTFIFGIGVDYSIFIMHGLVGEGGNGGEEVKEVKEIGERSRLLTAHKTAIFFSVVVLVVTVGSMLLAVHPAIRSVGFATIVGLLSAVILCYVLQPAAYRWLNRNK